MVLISFHPETSHSLLSTFINVSNNLYYCDDSIVTLCFDLNCLSSLWNSPVLLLHISCSSSVNIWIRWRLSLPVSVSLWVHFLHLLCQNLFVIKMFLISMSKSSSSVHLSFAGQLNVSCFSCGPPVFGPTLPTAFLVPLSTGSTAYVIPLANAVVTLMAVWVIVCIMVYISAISFCVGLYQS